MVEGFNTSQIQQLFRGFFFKLEDFSFSTKSVKSPQVVFTVSCFFGTNFWKNFLIRKKFLFIFFIMKTECWNPEFNSKPKIPGDRTSLSIYLKISICCLSLQTLGVWNKVVSINCLADYFQPYCQIEHMEEPSHA